MAKIIPSGSELANLRVVRLPPNKRLQRPALHAAAEPER